MNRIAGRALVTLVLVAVLVGGLAFFLFEFSDKAGDWVIFSGSPHVYNAGHVGAVVTDRDGEFLADLTGDLRYSEDSELKQAVLHWTGDRYGNISTPYLDAYAKALSGFNLLDGIYAYGTPDRRVRLTLSAALEKAALEALDGRHGTVALYNYRTGELLCAVSAPTFDPDHEPDWDTDTSGQYDGVFFNRFLQSTYIPGSIFKIVTVGAALESIPDIQEHTFYCEQSYDIGDGEVTCESWHGAQSIKEIFANSCNCGVAQLTELLGPERLEQYIRRFQVLGPVSFDGYTSEAGSVAVAGESPDNVAWSGIGQHKDEINPCRFLTFLGAIAGGGRGVEPHVVAGVTVNGSKAYTAAPVTGESVMSAGTAALLREFMRNNVETVYGDWNFQGFTVCAKSGTAETGDGRPNAMFAGFIEDESCPLAFVVAVEDSGYGASTCVPILSQVLETCREKLEEQGSFGG